MIRPSRNAPCPCGSGLKHKKCCLRKGELQSTTVVSSSVEMAIPPASASQEAGRAPLASPNRPAPTVNQQQRMAVSIEGLTEQELVELNHRVVERLRLLRQNRSQNQMLHFSVGEQVSFDGPDGKVITGVIERFNKKTVTIVSDQPHTHWRVHPGFLRKFQEAGAPALRLLKDR